MNKFSFIFPAVITVVTFSIQSPGQGLIICAGTKLTEYGGNLAIYQNLINNGTFIHTGGTFTFAGATQNLEGTSSATFNNLTITAGSTTTVSAPNQKLAGILLVDGILNANGNLILTSTASGTALIDGSGTGQVNGNVAMERYLQSGFGYKYFSSPFSSSTVNEFSDDINLAASFTTFYRYDEDRISSGWVNYKILSNVLQPMAGYAVNFGSSNSSVTADISGIVNNGAISSTLFNHNHPFTKGMNLVGNPYPSPINWNAASGWTKSNIDNSLYFFKAGESDQFMGSYASYINGVSSDGLATNIIPSMQAFFVHVSDSDYPVTATLGMNNNIRITDKNHSFIKSGYTNGSSQMRLIACFSDNPTRYDPLVIYFDEKATIEFDGQLDALKILNSDKQVPSLFSVTPKGKNLSICALPPDIDSPGTVPLGIKILKTGFITFRIRDIDEPFSNMPISILDNVTGTETALLPDKEYQIYLTAGEYKNRFFLNLNSISTVIADETTRSGDLLTIYSHDGILITEISKLENNYGTLMIFNQLGQKLFIQKIYSAGHFEFDLELKTGIYLVTFYSGKTMYSKKFFIENR